MTSKKRVEELKELGMCLNHSNRPAAEGHSYCQECRDAQKDRNDKNKRLGMCPGHKNRPAAKGSMFCQECLDSSKAKRIKNKAAGMCPNHENVPHAEGHVNCQKCIDYMKARRGEIIGAGMCTRHKNIPAVDGCRACLECLRNDKIRAYKHKGVVWAISDEDAVDRMMEPCYYCGKEAPEWGHGLDKVDPNGGYTLENAVSCCWSKKDKEQRCNNTKNACTPHIARKMLEHQIENRDELTLAWLNLLFSKIFIPTAIPQASHAQLSLDGGHF